MNIRNCFQPFVFPFLKRFLVSTIYSHSAHFVFVCVCFRVFCGVFFFFWLLLFTIWNESVSSSWKISPPVQSYSSQTTSMTGVLTYSLGDILCKYKKIHICFTSFCLFKCWHIIYNIVLYHSIHLVKYLDHFISIFKNLSEITSLPITSHFLSFITVWLYLYF